jgi:hypothetical protein
MYKKDYHPNENIVFDTKNYGFTSPKSAGLEPLSNALVQIDAALKKEETERIEEDVRINRRVDKEITDRENTDIAISNRISEYIVQMGSATRILNDANTAIGARRNVHSCAYGVGNYISVISIRGEFKGTVNISLAEIGLKTLTTTSRQYNSNIQGTLISNVNSSIDNSKKCNVVARANQTLFEIRTNITPDDEFVYFATTFIIERNL